MYLRILYKIHVVGFMSQHLCISRILCKIHVSGSMSQHLYISGSSARSTSPESCLSIFVSQDPLQDPCLRIHVSASLYLRSFCKIHVCISGSSVPSRKRRSAKTIYRQTHATNNKETNLRRRTSTMDPLRQPPNTSCYTNPVCLQNICLCLLYTSYLKILCRSHASDSCLSVNQYESSTRSTPSDSCLSIFISQDPLQDPCLRIQITASICISGSSARSMSPGSCLSIFASQAPIAQQPYVSQDPLQDPRRRIHVSASLYLTDSLQDPCLRIHVSASLYLRILCKIHVSGVMSQHLCISGSSARSMSPDPCLSIFISQELLQDPCLYLRILCKIHVSGSMSQHLYISGASARSMSPIHVLASLASDCVALRRRNANFDLRRRVSYGPAQGKESGRDPRERFAQAKRKF